MKTLVVALGGNALLQRGEALTAENQYRNIASAVPALARLARSYRLAIVHGNGPQVGLLASPQPRKILDSEAIELLLKEGHVVICSGGGGVPVTEDGAGSEAVIDKDLAAALLAEQINADGLVILTDADAVYENWGTPQQRAIRHATPDELAPFAKADGSMGPKVTAVSGYVRSRGKPAWIGALSRIEETLAGEAGTCISL